MQIIIAICSFLFLAVFLEFVVAIIWNFVCFFRKKGSCKFVNCPFRKRYTGQDEIFSTSYGCTKCPPTPEEEKIWKNTLEGLVTEWCEQERRKKKGKRRWKRTTHNPGS